VTANLLVWFLCEVGTTEGESSHTVRRFL